MRWPSCCPYVAFYKIASYELLWDDLWRPAATGKPVVLSTGMATLAEIVHAVQVLRGAGPRRSGCCTRFRPIRRRRRRPISPPSTSSAGRPGCPVGWSDHTVSPGVLHRAIHRWGAGFCRVPHRSRRDGRGICERPLLAAGPDFRGHQGGARGRGGGRSGLKTAAPSNSPTATGAPIRWTGCGLRRHPLSGRPRRPAHRGDRAGRMSSSRLPGKSLRWRSPGGR